MTIHVLAIAVFIAIAGACLAVASPISRLRVGIEKSAHFFTDSTQSYHRLPVDLSKAFWGESDPGSLFDERLDATARLQVEDEEQKHKKNKNNEPTRFRRFHPLNWQGSVTKRPIFTITGCSPKLHSPPQTFEEEEDLHRDEEAKVWFIPKNNHFHSRSPIVVWKGFPPLQEQTHEEEDLEIGTIFEAGGEDQGQNEEEDEEMTSPGISGIFRPLKGFGRSNYSLDVTESRDRPPHRSPPARIWKQEAFGDDELAGKGFVIRPHFKTGVTKDPIMPQRRYDGRAPFRSPPEGFSEENSEEQQWVRGKGKDHTFNPNFVKGISQHPIHHRELTNSKATLVRDISQASRK